MSRMNAKAFVSLVQKSSHFEEVAEAAGVTLETARSRYRDLIRKGVPLKTLTLKNGRSRALDIEALKKHALAELPEEPANTEVPEEAPKPKRRAAKKKPATKAAATP